MSPPNYIHSRAFDEVAQGFDAAFRALGLECEIVRESSQMMLLGTMSAEQRVATTLAPEGDTGYAQTAFADVANRDGSFGAAASSHSAKTQRTRDGKLAGRRIT